MDYRKTETNLDKFIRDLNTRKTDSGVDGSFMTEVTPEQESSNMLDNLIGAMLEDYCNTRITVGKREILVYTESNLMISKDSISAQKRVVEVDNKQGGTTIAWMYSIKDEHAKELIEIWVKEGTDTERITTRQALAEKVVKEASKDIISRKKEYTKTGGKSHFPQLAAFSTKYDFGMTEDMRSVNTKLLGTLMIAIAKLQLAYLCNEGMGYLQTPFFAEDNPVKIMALAEKIVKLSESNKGTSGKTLRILVVPINAEEIDTDTGVKDTDKYMILQLIEDRRYKKN